MTSSNRSYNLYSASLLILVALCACEVPPTPCMDTYGGLTGASCGATADCHYDCDDAEYSPTSVLTCARFGRTCRPASELPLGETCTDSAQCASRLCDPASAACTAPCAADTDCGDETVCVQDDSGWFCRPICVANSDCAVYRRKGGQAILTCLAITSRGGLLGKACGVRP